MRKEFLLGSAVAVLLTVPVAINLLPVSAWADVNVLANQTMNKVQIKWRFPCSGPPTEVGEQDAVTRGDPPPEVCLIVQEWQRNPENFDNRIKASGCVRGDTTASYALTTGCAEAGGSASAGNPLAALFGTLGAGVPTASVGLSPDSPVRFRVERIVTPTSLIPDIVRLTFLDGALRTSTATLGDESSATLKMIVYGDLAAAQADNGLTGLGGALFNAVTLNGATGSLSLVGLSLGDVLVQGDGAGTFTATPIAGLSRDALVPDANDAVVSIVADPRSNSNPTIPGSGPSTFGQSGPDAGLWLGPAVPNPTQEGTSIRFGIPQAAQVTLAVYDQLGRRVRELVNASLPAGTHTLDWDGRDGAGRPVASALYFYRLVVDGRSLTGKVFKLR